MACGAKKLLANRHVEVTSVRRMPPESLPCSGNVKKSRKKQSQIEQRKYTQEPPDIEASDGRKNRLSFVAQPAAIE
jgi:hypothetical protein